ncbi:RNA-directed DNA polymerase from mobile element jockey [Pitangus sulphuratus]|nr:RNA-directed DNA polymerase from mobile element jockey [Pitangus sulphuratus]
MMHQGGLSALSWRTIYCQNDQLLLNPEIVWDLLLQLDPYKSTGLDGVHPRMLKELAGIITKPFSMFFEGSWEPAEVTLHWKLAKVVLIFKESKNQDPRNYRFTSKYWKITLGGTEKHLKDNAVSGHSQHS